MFKRGMLFAITLAICAPFFARATEQNLSDDDMLGIANSVASSGDLDTAGQIYTNTMHSGNYDTRIESVFQLANIAMARGDYETAINYYYEIVKNNPALSRVRLELARAYFMSGDYEQAQFHFEFVRATPELPDDVAAKIDAFLTLIRQQKNWTLDFGFGVVPDSNLNNAGNQNTECIDTVFGPLCRPLDTAQHGVGVRLNATGNYYLRFTKRFGLRTTLGVNLLDFDGSDFDDYSVYLASGPRYTFDRGEISLQPAVRAQWYAGDFYNYGYGLRLDTNWQLMGRLFAGAGATVHKTEYDATVNQDALGGYDWGLYLQPRYYLNNTSYIMAGIGFDQNNTNIDAYGSDSISYSLGYFGEFGWGFAFTGRASLIDSKYHDSAWYVINNQFDQRTRNDLTWQFYAQVYNTKLGWYNLVPAISYMYTLRDSNVPLYEFDRHRIEIEIIRRF